MPSILLADDNPHARRMGRQVLAEEGYQVWLASNGDEALDSAVEHRPDLAIVGTRMGGLSGFDLCYRIKTNPELEHMRVILLAGPREPLDAAPASARSDGILRKPLDPDSVLRTVRSLLGEEARADQPAERPSRPGPESDSPVETPAPGLPRVEAFGEDGTGEDSGPPGGSSATGTRSPLETPVHEQDPFADVVKTALAKVPGVDPAEVRVAVASAVEAAVPEIVDRVTEQILKAMRKP